MKPRWYIPVLYIVFWQSSYFFKFSPWIVMLSTMPVLFLYYRRFLGDRKWPYSPVLFAILAFLLIMPAFLTHTLNIVFYSSTFINSMEYSLALSMILVPVIFSTLVDMSGRKIFYGMIASGAAYFLVITPVFVPYTLIQIVKILLYQLSFDLAFSIYVSYLYISVNKKLVTPVLFFFLYSTFSFLDITEKVSPLFNIVWEIIAVSILFWMTYFALGENIWVKKLLKSKKKIHIRRKTKASDVAFAVFITIIAAGAIGGYVTHTVAADPTPSMYPVIVPGSLLIIRPAPAQTITTGEIIEFHAPWDNGTLYAHEVVQIKNVDGKIYFRTRGINNPVDDPGLVPSSDLVGIVIYHVPYLGYPLIYGRVTAAAVMIIIVASVVREGTSGHRGRRSYV